MTTDEATNERADVAVKLHRLSKLLSSTLERMEAIESLQAVTVGEQADVSEQLGKLADRLRLIVSQQCTCTTREVLGGNVFRNGTEHEEYRPS
jgi:hypothetical protein